MSSPLAQKTLENLWSIPRHDIDSLFSAKHVDTVYQAKQSVLKRGQQLDKFAIVMSGWLIRSRLTFEGRRQILHVLLPGDFISLDSLVGSQSDHDVETLTPATVRVLHTETVVSMMANSPTLAAGIWRCVIQEVGSMREQLVRIGRRSALMSLSQFFLEMHQRLLAIGQADRHTMSLHLTQNEIGDILGLSSVHVNRTLQVLKREELLQVDGQTIRIPSIKGLAVFCDFDLGNPQPVSEIKLPNVGRAPLPNFASAKYSMAM